MKKNREGDRGVSLRQALYIHWHYVAALKSVISDCQSTSQGLGADMHDLFECPKRA